MVISFMNEIRAASIALAAYLVSSADSQFMVMKLSSRLTSGSYNRRIMRNASGDSPPMTMRSGFQAILHRASFAQEFRIGRHCTSAVVCCLRKLYSLRLVPAGTVDFTTIVTM
jgi:hypothetical protein